MAQTDGPDIELLKFVNATRRDFARLMMEHEFAVDEVRTKVSILQREFLHLHRYNPIEHITSRVKTVESTVEKLMRRNLDPTVASARENLTDIAGVRIVCSFIADTYRVADALTAQSDLEVVTVKDYIANPKPNGYKSLHVIVAVPVFLSDGPVPVPVEVQIRTIAMDFWAALEHKIHYKFDGAVPEHLVRELTEAAAAAEQLDRRMEQLHSAVHAEDDAAAADPNAGFEETIMTRLWEYVSSRGAS